MEVNMTEVILDFLNVAIHQILFNRDIYPEDVFSQTKHYGIPVRMSRHPDLNQYIVDSLIASKDWLNSGEAKKIVIHVEDRENNPLERFVFEIKSLQDAVEGMSLQDVEKRFADFLLKIALADLKPNPQDCKFSIVTYTTANQLGSEWIAADQKEITNQAIKPLKALQTGNLNLQLFVEENVQRKMIWANFEKGKNR